ncbi:HNH endonuclease [Delftia tsuruhatensis]|uniref:HNH endonuclease n=1 Tax=Delftia tsuruhatensis TaxID=180282 RepID=UPI003A8C11BC
MSKKELTAEMARRLLNYDPVSGDLRWVLSPRRNVQAGSLAGSKHPSGYAFIKIHCVSYPVHRLVWLMTFGVWPSDQIDHRNGIRDDNRIANLRECTSGQNNQNTAVYRSNRSGHTGVSWHKATGKWRARIDRQGVQYVLGHFDDVELAKQAYLSAKAALHSFQPVPRHV